MQLDQDELLMQTLLKHRQTLASDTIPADEVRNLAKTIMMDEERLVSAIDRLAEQKRITLKWGGNVVPVISHPANTEKGAPTYSTLQGDIYVSKDESKMFVRKTSHGGTYNDYNVPEFEIASLASALSSIRKVLPELEGDNAKLLESIDRHATNLIDEVKNKNSDPNRLATVANDLKQKLELALSYQTLLEKLKPTFDWIGEIIEPLLKN